MTNNSVILCCLFEYPWDWTTGLTQIFYLKN